MKCVSLGLGKACLSLLKEKQPSIQKLDHIIALIIKENMWKYIPFLDIL